mgnify:CR=1 FL=1
MAIGLTQALRICPMGRATSAAKLCGVMHESNLMMEPSSSTKTPMRMVFRSPLGLTNNAAHTGAVSRYTMGCHELSNVICVWDIFGKYSAFNAASAGSNISHDKPFTDDIAQKMPSTAYRAGPADDSGAST